ncbi:ATP-binding protein [Burkholderia multivorans]|uniref:AlbA family DNA-binding domain-containing protein n=1 Tax=Burkholderia multivorans TaxID=87883 RepID=UPI000D00E6E2|nr:ATP-binding protein [Burkholderia multivorans]AYY97089.1 ATP-binding protein [Burkholderia multivorans]MBU9123539.1 ATP-binding protein [Burkholderia multivorans]PRF44293.1 hypothetical protein C6Q04_27030 [Burkholderia multivorans]PRG50755.1 hypothetical protein C6T63_17635 [Burkholderia multivorans]
MDITDIIKQGETQAVEFKEGNKMQKEAYQDLCAMMNTQDGVGGVILGVADNGEVVGMRDANLDTLQRDISNHVSQKFEPQPKIEMRVEDVGDKKVLIVIGTRPRDVPYCEYDGRAYIRRGTASPQLTYDEKKHLQKFRDRDHHPGPWRCDRCGKSPLRFNGITTDAATGKSVRAYNCMCGGEMWPA